LDYPVLSDPSKTTARAYGVLRAGLFTARHTFIIGQDGRVLDLNTKVRARSSGEDLVARLEELGIAKIGG
jgi:peroxiredoxin Q/BCP